MAISQINFLVVDISNRQFLKSWFPELSHRFPESSMSWMPINFLFCLFFNWMPLSQVIVMGWGRLVDKRNENMLNILVARAMPVYHLARSRLLYLASPRMRPYQTHLDLSPPSFYQKDGKLKKLAQLCHLLKANKTQLGMKFRWWATEGFTFLQHSDWLILIVFIIVNFQKMLLSWTIFETLKSLLKNLGLSYCHSGNRHLGNWIVINSPVLAYSYYWKSNNWISSIDTLKLLPIQQFKII